MRTQPLDDPWSLGPLPPIPATKELAEKQLWRGFGIWFQNCFRYCAILGSYRLQTCKWKHEFHTVLVGPRLTITTTGAVYKQPIGGNWAIFGRKTRGGKQVRRQREKRKRMKIWKAMGLDYIPVEVLFLTKLFNCSLFKPWPSFSCPTIPWTQFLTHFTPMGWSHLSVLQIIVPRLA